MVNGWERLEKVIAWSGLTVNAFALKIGLKRAENLYRILRDKGSISKKLAELITSEFSEISMGWLLCGEGHMIKPLHNDSSPIFHNKTPDRNSVSDFPFLSCKNESSVLMLDNSTISAVMPDHSMYPTIPENAYVFMRRRLPGNIVSGRIYFVVTPYFTGIRVVKEKNTATDELILEPVNKSCFREMAIRQKDIRHIYLIYSIVIKV